MNAGTIPDTVSTLGHARRELEEMARTAEGETLSVVRAFEGLAGHSDTILGLAAAIVACVEDESVTSVLPIVKTLGAEAEQFIAERLQASTGILQTVNTEVSLLRQLSEVASNQEAIALEIKVLSVLTNIEVARLGSIGTGFQYLAHELSDFSKSVVEDTQELANHAQSRRTAIEETRRMLSAELPRLRAELARIESDLSSALEAIDTSLTQLSRTPAQFRASVEDIARQIAGVVAALQSQDITRQMNEHVQEAFQLISNRIQEAGESEKEQGAELPQTYAGLTIQSYQLRSIKETVGGWIAQVRGCLDGILRVSASDVVGIGPVVLEQEHKVSAHLARIELLERQSEVQSERIRQTLGGLSNLLHLVTEHVERSKSIRDRLRMLAFNSIIEASHLGTKADVILAISKSIKEVSISWSQITEQSEQAMQEIVKLVEQSSAVTKVFSQAGSEKLREVEAQTRTGLDNFRGAASFAAGHAQDMKLATEKMQAKLREIGKKSDGLDTCFGRCDAVLTTVDGLRLQLETDDPGIKKRYNATEVEQIFSAAYTTELERDVLRAALQGKALPLAKAMLAGNSVELF